MSGLTDQGFDRARLADIKEEIEASLRTSLGNAINLNPESVLGQIVGIIAERESLIWQVSEQVYNSQYPDTATGTSLDNVAALTGISRLAATFSVVKAQLYGTAGTLIPLGTLFSVDGNSSAQFATRNNVTLVAGANEVQHIAFSVVPTGGSFKLTFNGQETSALLFSATTAQIKAALEALSNIDTVTVTGTFAAGFDITFTGQQVKKRDVPLLTVSSNLLTPATVVTITTTTPGVEQGSVFCDATLTGPVQAFAETLTVIVTPIFGLDSVFNLADTIEGRNIETDLELRQRRVRTLQVAGAGTVEAIRSRLLALTEVIAALVFENVTLITDVDGRPPKSFEAVVQGGDDATIGQTIWLAKPAGIETFGNQTTFVTDSQGFVHAINWSRPTEVPIWITVTITTDVTFTSNAAEIKQAFVDDSESTIGIGDDVIVYPTLICILGQFTGIVDVVIAVGIAPGPTLDNNIILAPQEIATFDTARIVVIII